MDKATLMKSWFVESKSESVLVFLFENSICELKSNNENAMDGHKQFYKYNTCIVNIH